MEANKLQTSSSMLASKLSEARTNALKRNRAAWLRVDAAAGRVQVQTSGGGGRTLDIGAPGLLPSGVAFVEPAAKHPVRLRRTPVNLRRGGSRSRSRGDATRAASVTVVARRRGATRMKRTPGGRLQPGELLVATVIVVVCARWAWR
jgi:Tfp pilus assembly protein FimT